jgi:hypothetical protein
MGRWGDCIHERDSWLSCKRKVLRVRGADWHGSAQASNIDFSVTTDASGHESRPICAPMLVVGNGDSIQQTEYPGSERGLVCMTVYAANLSGSKRSYSFLTTA